MSASSAVNRFSVWPDEEGVSGLPFISVIVAFIITLFGAGLALAEGASPDATPVNFVFGSSEFRITTDGATNISIYQTMELTSLIEGAQELSLPMSIPGAKISTLSLSCPRGRTEGARGVALTQRPMAEGAGVLVTLGEPLNRYQNCRLYLEYGGGAASLLRTYTEDEDRFGELNFIPRTWAPIKEATVVVDLPKDWSPVASRPPGRLQSSTQRTTMTWSLGALSPRDSRPISMTMTNRPVPQPVVSISIMGSFLGAGAILGGLVVVGSRRNLGGLWQVPGTALGLLDQWLVMLHFSESLILAFKNLSRRKARASMTFLGVMLGGAILATQAFSSALNYGRMGELGLASHLYVMVGITMGVCFYCVATTMLTTVSQRRGEVGVMKAVGMSPGWVMRLFLSESLFFGLLAGGMGAGLGFLMVARPYLFLYFPKDMTTMVLGMDGGLVVLFLTLSAARNKSGLLAGIILSPLVLVATAATQLRLESTFPLQAETGALVFGLVLGFIILVCLVAGLYPAWKASRLYPVEALR